MAISHLKEQSLVQGHPGEHSGYRAHDDLKLARGLGLLGIGLGLAGVVTAGGLARSIGLKNTGKQRALLRAVGMREVASGVALIRDPKPRGWLWSRVAGDAMDISYLGWEIVSGGSRRRGRTGAALASLLGITALDVLCGVALNSRPNHAVAAITINRPPEEIYRFWHDFKNLPSFMSNLEQVEITGERTSHWKAWGPAGALVEWDAEIVEDRPNELIVWQSIGSPQVEHFGQVRFRPAPGGRGTEVIVVVRFDLVGGTLGQAMAKLFGKEPGQEISGDLRRLKQVLETGEVTVSDGSLGGIQYPQRPARPIGSGVGSKQATLAERAA
jgi:uncharacterized membrane protein